MFYFYPWIDDLGTDKHFYVPLYFFRSSGEKNNSTTIRLTKPPRMTIPLILLSWAIFAGFLLFLHLLLSDGKPFASHIDLFVAIPAILVGSRSPDAMIFYRKETNIPKKSPHLVVLPGLPSGNSFG